MLEDDSRQEILSLMKQHDLDHERLLFENDSIDIDRLSQILITAYVKTDNHDFFIHFYRITYPLLIKKAAIVMKSMRVNQVTSEDIVADAFTIMLNLFQKNRLEDISRPFPYLSRIVRNLVYSTILKNKKIKGFSQYDINSGEYNYSLDKIARIEENTRRDLHEDVLREMALGKYNGLADREKHIFDSFYLDDLPAKVIAERLNISTQTVYKTLYRTKQKVKEKIGYFKSLEKGKGEA